MLAEYLLDTNFAKSEHAGEDYKANLQHNLSDAIAILPSLTTGIDVNIRFNDVSGIEYTKEMAVFDLLGVDVVHGWVVDPQDKATSEAIGSRTYNQLVCQLVNYIGGSSGRISRTMSKISGEEENQEAPQGKQIDSAMLSSALEGLRMSIPEENVDKGGPTTARSDTSRDSLSIAISSMLSDTVKDAFKTPLQSVSSPDTHVLSKSSDNDDMILPNESNNGLYEKSKTDDLKEAIVIKEFLESHPSQLTVYGITSMMERLAEGQLAVFFRNNHFNVLLKKGTSLYILVTDQGYQSEPDIIWEKLINIDGDTEFVDWKFAKFKPHQEPEDVPDIDTIDMNTVINDYDLALQLQKEEEMRSRQIENAQVVPESVSTSSSRVGRREMEYNSSSARSKKNKKDKSSCSIM